MARRGRSTRRASSRRRRSSCATRSWASRDTGADTLPSSSKETGKVGVMFRRGVIIAVFAFMLGSSSIVVAGGLGVVGANGVIAGCVNPSGVLRITFAGDGCNANETAVSWNQSGPAGATGATGPAGTTGATGATGATGPAGTFSGTFTSPNGQYAISVTDTGIVLSGPGTDVIKLDSAGAR